MSTKTTFKRISLVAVAALGFGVLSVVPSSATIASVATASATSATLYTTAGTEVTTTVKLLTTTAATEAQTITLTPTITSQPAGTTVAIGAPGAGKAGMTTAGTLGANVATAATADKWTAAAAAGVETLAWSSGTIPAFASGSEQVVGTFSVTPSAAGKYVFAVTPTGTASNTPVTITVYASGASATVGTAGLGTAAVTATTGGAAAFTYTFPNATTVGTVYTFQSTGVGIITGGTGIQTDGTAMNPVPYNGTAGDFSAGAKWTTATVTTSGTATINLQSAVAGTQTVTITKIDPTTGSPTAVTTVVTTWTAAPTLSVTESTSWIDTTTASTFTAAIAADATVAVDGTVPSARVATIKVLLKDSVKNAIASKTISASVTGPGLIYAVTGTGTANTYTEAGSPTKARVATADTDALGQVFIAVYADGSGGVGTITISQGTTVIATETVTFSGAATQLKDSNLDADKASLNKVFIGVKETGTLKVSSYDAAGNKVVTSPTGLVVTSDSTTVATVSISGGTGDITVTGVAVGKANITVSVGALATATIKLVIPVEITKVTAKTVSMAWDKTSYAPGEKMTLTVKAVDSNGAGVADGARVLFSDTATANVALGTLPTGTVTLAGGIKTYTYYAPFAAGDITVTATEGAAVDAVIASTTAAPYTAAKITATTSVVNAGQDAATDAAIEATDAANAATDAALAAADAADAATAAAEDASAAVAKLAKSVSTALTALKKQITALTALVNKLLKK